jgi:hypothetical protein
MDQDYALMSQDRVPVDPAQDCSASGSRPVLVDMGQDRTLDSFHPFALLFLSLIVLLLLFLVLLVLPLLHSPCPPAAS